MIKILNDPNLVADILDKEFNCLPPHPNFGDIVAIEEDGEVKAFMCRELLIHVGTVWVKPDDRRTVKAAKWLKALTDYVIVNMPKGSSTVIVDETGLYGKLLRLIGFYKKTGTTYRIDLEAK